MKHFEMLESGTEPRNKVVNILPALQTAPLSFWPHAQAMHAVTPVEPQPGCIPPTSIPPLLWRKEEETGQALGIGAHNTMQHSSGFRLLILKFTQSHRVEMPEFNTTFFTTCSAKCPWVFNRPNFLALWSLDVLHSLFFNP